MSPRGVAFEAFRSECGHSARRAGRLLRPEHLPLEPFPTSGAHLAATILRLADVERAHILRVLELVRGNRTQAAERLGISRSTLKNKLAEINDPSG